MFQPETIELDKSGIRNVLEFENEIAIFSIDLIELAKNAQDIKDTDTTKYKNFKIEIDNIISIDSASRDTVRIIESSYFETFILEDFIQKKIETGEIIIFDKKSRKKIESVVILRPLSAHFRIFQVFLDHERSELIFERKTMIVSR